MNHLVIASAPLILLSLFSAGGKTVMITQAQNQSKVRVKKDASFQLLLNANPTTGFDWRIVSYDSAIIQIKQKSFIQSETHRMGAPGKQVFKFKAIAAGATDLRLIYARPWERATAEADSFRVHIIVPK
ncbi:MAG TPA: protease inhibitor I42 family protein [bacterium]|nr:protease inhibitor I42 family protein [bacterium]HPN34195.1 protease inhibitor I42 family protein [bacterium]